MKTNQNLSDLKATVPAFGMVSFYYRGISKKKLNIILVRIRNTTPRKQLGMGRASKSDQYVPIAGNFANA
jgi:hypothetical protein